jgi:U3 small nucleolar RNA-associated protein 18
MAPVATIPHKSNNHQRYLPEKTSNVADLSPDFVLEESDTETGALQPVSETQEPEWEGFGGEESAKNSDEDEESDTDSIQIKLDTKKQEKPILPKDAEEEELERMIFGDSAGFKQGLEDFSLDRTAGAYGELSDEDQDEDVDIEGVADQDLFFFDAGPVAAPAGSVAVAKADETDEEDDKPAWEDSDDERLVVSLASVPQLRKLRETVDDDMVNGKEYSRRLRRQYERLYPMPDWAMHATGKANRKRRRTMEDGESGEGSASDMDMDEEDLSSQPLARLLKDADILSRNTRGPMKRRKLQAGTVDIQRLKDVMKAGPVSNKLYHVWINLLTIYLVCDNLAIIPSCLPTTPLIRPELNSIPASRQPKSTEPEPSAHITAYQAHTSNYDCLPSVRVRLAHIPERPTSLLPRLEHRYRQGGKGFAHLWT